MIQLSDLQKIVDNLENQSDVMQALIEALIQIDAARSKQIKDLVIIAESHGRSLLDQAKTLKLMWEAITQQDRGVPTIQ